MSEHRTPALEPAIIVIFGITGDLAQRKLMPALYHLFKDNLLHENTVILGVTRRDVTADDLLGQVELCVNEVDGVCDPAIVGKVRDRLQMMQMDITEGSEYDRLLERLNAIETETGQCMNRLYYLSIPPQVFGPIVRFLGEHGLNASCQHDVAMTRLLVEKPFGYDLQSAHELIEETGRQFAEDQIFRIDHYVAKETVQNILTFRLNNPIFQSVWDTGHIDSIQITASEKIGIEGRAIFYEQTGALRDFIQSHLLQLLAIVTMELPQNLTSEAIHAAKLKLLNDIKPLPADKLEQVAVRGQYDTYKTEVANTGTTVETYAAIKLEIDNERWGGTTVLVRTGKALAEKLTKVVVSFRPAHGSAERNLLTFRIQPNEGIELDLEVKKPGYDREIQPAPMEFSYERTFQDANGHPDAYERVLVDAVRGDHTLFATSQEVLAAWEAVEPVVRAWSGTEKGLHTYPAGSWGPAAADTLAEEAGTAWF